MPNAEANAATVRLLAPEFAPATDDQIAPFLRLALNLCSSRRFGEEFQDAHGLAAAHWMKMDAILTTSLGVASGGAAQVASESHGPASISYAVAQPKDASDAWLSGSVYGQQFKVIRDRKRGRGSAVRIGNSTPQQS